MKSLKRTFLLIALFFTSQVHGQSSIQATDAFVDFDGAQRPCLQLHLDPEPKTLKKAWKDYLQDHYDLKLKGIGFLSNKDLLSAEEQNVAQISSKLLDFYTQIVEDQNGSEMKVFVRYGYDIYMTEANNPNDYAAVHGIINDFLKFYLPKYYQEKINDTEKRVEELVKETSKLNEEIADDTEKISVLKQEIEEMEATLKTKNELLESTNEKLTMRTHKMERMRTQLRQL